MAQGTTVRAVPPPPVMDVSEATFEREVIQRSYDAPVVIDFWAPWCGPCRTLGPIMEKLANEANGAWTLVKVNVDENPRLSQAFRVQGIPAVKAVHAGKLVDEFTGALPESRVRAWLKGFVGEGKATVVEEDLAAMEQTNPEEAIKRYQAAIAQNPDDAESRMRLGKLLLLHGEPGAAAVLSAVPDSSPLYGVAQALLPMAEFQAIADEPAPKSEGWSAEARYHAAAQAVRQRDYEAGIDALLEIVARNRAFRDDAARKMLLALFAALGDEHPLAVSGRRRLANALF